MHKQICINRIFTLLDKVDILYPHSELLWSTNSIRYYTDLGDDLHFEQTTLINNFMFRELFTNNTNSTWVLSNLYDEENNLIQKFKDFNHFYSINLSNFQNKNTQVMLSLMKKCSATFEYSYVRASSAEELEILTSPNYYASGLHQLNLFVTNEFLISSQFYENIKTIRPKFVFYSSNNFNLYNLSFALNLWEIWALSINCSYTYSSIKLTFTNTPLLFANRDKDNSKFYFAKYFKWEIEADDKENKFYFWSNEKEKENYTSFIKLTTSNFIKMAKLKEITSEKENIKEFNQINFKSDNEWTLFIPLSHLNEVKIVENSLRKIESNTDKNKILFSLFQSPKIRSELTFNQDYVYLNSEPKLPSHCKYSVYNSRKDWIR